MYDQQWNIPEKEVGEESQSLKNPRNPRKENRMSLKDANQRNQRNVDVGKGQKKVALQVQSPPNLQNPQNLQKNLTQQQLLRIHPRHRLQLLRWKIFLLKKTTSNHATLNPYCMLYSECKLWWPCQTKFSPLSLSVFRFFRKWMTSTVSFLFCFIFSRNKLMTCNVSQIIF